ncbi:hypothetical protein [Amylolactobacillus amylophilus]|uniref:hypothetical protein n=1 Tax=Amylolactobacillus amylophilus TaxID=1603 RepID=UPI002092FFE6|nr:hypothetical protein [Amylolactobacillus amylophilus]
MPQYSPQGATMIGVTTAPASASSTPFNPSAIKRITINGFPWLMFPSCVVSLSGLPR